MHLIEVDVVGAEPAETALARANDVVPRPRLVLRLLERRRPLRRDDDLGAARAERLAEPFLTRTVRSGGVEQVEPFIERGRDHRLGLVFVDAEAEVVAADADDRDVQA